MNSLRSETSELHRKIEKDNLASKVIDHSITREEYKLLLFQNFIAYSIAEAEITKFLDECTCDKSMRLNKDLQKLGVDLKFSALDFNCCNEAEAIGAAYVIEGSAMGGMLIGKEVENCDSLQDLSNQEFFNGNRGNIKSWNSYLKFLRSREFSKEETNLAVKKAKETFLLFQKAFSINFSHCN